MAPPSAKATKQQQIQSFGTYGICIETNTKVNDVPLTDCFVVDDQILIEPSSSSSSLENNKNCVTINAYFQVRFIKSTIWKRIIETTTNNEFSKFFMAYANMLQDVIEHGGEKEQIMLSSVKSNKEDETLVIKDNSPNCTTSNTGFTKSYNDSSNKNAVIAILTRTLQEYSILAMFIFLVIIILMQQCFMWKQISMFQNNYLVLQEHIFELKKNNEDTKRNWMKVIETLDKLLDSK